MVFMILYEYRCQNLLIPSDPCITFADAPFGLLKKIHQKFVMVTYLSSQLVSIVLPGRKNKRLKRNKSSKSLNLSRQSMIVYVVYLYVCVG